MDLSTWVFEPIESDGGCSDDGVVPAGVSQATQMPIATSSSRTQQMVVQADAGLVEDTHECYRQVNSSLGSTLHDDDDETVKAVSDDGHSYAGTVVRGVLRGDSE